MPDIGPLKEEHLDAAAALAAVQVTLLAEQVPNLPQRYSESANILPLLQSILQAGGPGVAAMQAGQLVGYLIAWLMPEFHGKRSVYSPEWANAADSNNKRAIYEDMYQHIAAEWVSERYTAHYISLLANDDEPMEALHWLGFGMYGVDALRGLHPIPEKPVQMDIRPAERQDVEQVYELHQELRQFTLGSPYFFIDQQLSPDYFAEWIADPKRIIWLAYITGEPAAYLQIGPANDDVATIIYEEKTTSIYGAYTKDSMRGRGIGTALLGKAIESARQKGYHRCAVDFESMNLSGARFWFKHDFRPVCLSVLRYVDERVL